ncbi:helix-turn-helix transcriptional regulator [Nonomuraea sp. NPDC003709]|uniref:helix-turn-helix domain-containing protein n=1 Tax=Nonomuraea sp. NPDC003709 TaxID=3154450 RepID=UPI0033B8E24E
MKAPDSPLTRRGTEILRLPASEAQPADIAERLCLTYGTVRNHLTSAVAKLGARNRVDAIRIANEPG